MKNENLGREAEYMKVHRLKRKWKLLAGCLAVVVTIGTVRALLLPAATMGNEEKTWECPAHIHQHTAECYDAENKLICGQADYVVHVHDDNYCKDSDGNLVCPLPQIEEHQHTEECYVEQQVLICGETEREGHIQDESCYTSRQGELTCGMEEHTHAPECYPEGSESPVCGKEEHVHTEACYAAGGRVLTCGMEEESGHQHSEACYETQRVLNCEKLELHTHNEACYDAENHQICGLLQLEEHVHTGICFQKDEESEVSLANTGDEISQDVRDALAEDGVYPSREYAQEKKEWVAYDAATEADANVKVFVKLPDEAVVPDNYYLFVRKVVEGEPHYPAAQAVQTVVGDTNDFQCYAIHWVKIDGENYDYNTDSVIPGESMQAEVRMQYLKEGARLKGETAHRKLLIYNSTNIGSALENVSGTMTAVKATDDAYTEFTFVTSKAGPYVFVSKYIFPSYIANIDMSITDGSAPWDNSDTAGNDSGPNNGVVRSYDTIEYALDTHFAARDTRVTAAEAVMYFELTLDKGLTEAQFDTSQMLWMGSDYRLEYLDSNGNVTLLKDSKGKYYTPAKDGSGNLLPDANGNAQPGNEVTINSLVTDSTEGVNSYTCPDIRSQRITGKTTLKATDKNPNVLAATQTFSAAIQVRNANNGDTFAPKFRLWLDKNEENYGPEASEDGKVHPAEIVDKNNVPASPVTVSAGTNFNVQIKKNGDLTYKNWFDFETGALVDAATREELERLAFLKENWGKSNPSEFTENGQALGDEKKAEYARYRYGRITGYGITLQLYNNTDNNPDGNRAAKGLKGYSLPIGDITFDLNITSRAGYTISGDPIQKGEDTVHYTPILWEYNENKRAKTGGGHWGRNLFWNKEERSDYGKGAAPFNQSDSGGNEQNCYNGGTWSVTESKTSPVEAENVTSVSGTGAGMTYHFTVSGYDFDFDNMHFPTRDAGNGADNGEYKTYAKSFSAGFFQVLNVIPRYQAYSVVDLENTVTVNNLSLVTRAGQPLNSDSVQNNSTGYEHEVNKKDNTRTDKIDLYAIGGLTKGSSFNSLKWEDDKGQLHETSNVDNGYLGTGYWSTSYDCNTYAGDNIYLLGYGLLNAGTDYRIKSMNLLQLFDSRALTINGNPSIVWDTANGTAGEVKFLYAADPKYPNGYDTSGEGGTGKDGYGNLSYMNGVREEALVYSTTKTEDGYITVQGVNGGNPMKCVGVLMEVRGCDLMGGKYQYLRIPVHVNGDDEELVGKTIATVNTVRIWTDANDMKDVSWESGEWNKQGDDKNWVEHYVKPTGSADKEHDGKYSAEVANGNNNENAGNTKQTAVYTKTEYVDGKQKSGTHSGGVQSGNSLLILSYEAGIHINVDRDAESNGSITYNFGKSEDKVVNYILNNIQTKIDADRPGQTDTKLTNLTIRTALDEGHTGNSRIMISDGSCKMEGYMVDENGQPVGESAPMTISSDAEHPTSIGFYDSKDGKFHSFTIYAVFDGTGRNVTFHLEGIPVGSMLPNITFSADLQSAVKDNDRITTNTYISGTGDCRAYTTTNGNTSNVTIGIIQQSGTSLSKAVNTRYIEMNGKISYTIGYTSNSTLATDSIYFNDVLPYMSDVRGSRFTGFLALKDVSVALSDSDGKDVGLENTKVFVYYSTRPSNELIQATNNFKEMEQDQIDQLIADYFQELGEISQNNNANGLQEKNVEGVTGILLKVENLAGKRTISLKAGFDTRDNAKGDIYKNVANSKTPTGAMLTSNQVETLVLGRRISGMVWHDKNLNGIRDDGEPVLSGVNATLLKKDTDGTYKPCKNVAGEDVVPCVTDNNGEYAFNKLSAGDYIVAFSDGELEKYTGAAEYQTDGGSDYSNDGVQISDLKEEIENSGNYRYAIQFSKSENAVKLHTISEITAPNSTIQLNDNEEQVNHQDLGVIAAGPEMPETGGPGTICYAVSGAILMAGALIYHSYRRKRRNMES